MGGYKSLKRVLGETHLGRKLRWLFGVCLFGLVLIAFWLVDWIGEDLVMRNIHRNGREWVRYHIFDKHWEVWETDVDRKPFRAEFSKRLLPEGYNARTISTDRDLVKRLNDSGFNLRPSGKNAAEQQRLWAPENADEVQLLRQLQADFEQVVASQPAPNAGDDEQRNLAHERFESVFARRIDHEADKYYYYQPVYWDRQLCLSCHEGSYGKFSISASDAAATGTSQLPFLVTRVDLPYGKTRSAVNWIRAVLLTVGILTVFLSMVALWMVVRYVVLKPLAHLREVSDSVTRGDLDQRAEINTNDEFEELAASFNKMLRHLIEAQGQLQTANKDLDGKVDELAQLNMQLHEMNRLKGEFLANMSHELRTPLNSIIGFSEVLGGIDSLSDKQKRYANNIQKSGRDLLEMINDILDLSKLEAGRMDLRLSEFRIDAIIHSQCDIVRPLAEDKNIDLAIEIEPDLPTLFQDQAKVQQILTNLLSNAIKFTPEGGRITVGAKGNSRGFIELSVEDTGVGIAESDREIIFEKFRQGTAVLGRDILTREYSGTGLGLSIVKELCKLLGGEVHVESELGKGSTFRVLIPWMRAEQPQHASKLNARLDEITRPRRGDAEQLSTDTVVISK
ncbi:Signal transduction histidine-protein kinase BarA [Anatilimnocola aggregata]|uniref:histidine kinase n=1 Tax=Anatilimnocola aggregata TaxID=2528021 RepID=A0A517YMT2_9BACT|nr:ATP-binding protein [Anatilimnocola aggregata]QDU31521.1 Signal transduction histidine-protein kinase BarA [Anatilimnocola aggregata]